MLTLYGRKKRKYADAAYNWFIDRPKIAAAAAGSTIGGGFLGSALAAEKAVDGAWHARKRRKRRDSLKLEPSKKTTRYKRKKMRYARRGKRFGRRRTKRRKRMRKKSYRRRGSSWRRRMPFNRKQAKAITKLAGQDSGYIKKKQVDSLVMSTDQTEVNYFWEPMCTASQVEGIIDGETRRLVFNSTTGLFEERAIDLRTGGRGTRVKFKNNTMRLKYRNNYLKPVRLVMYTLVMRRSNTSKDPLDEIAAGFADVSAGAFDISSYNFWPEHSPSFNKTYKVLKKTFKNLKAGDEYTCKVKCPMFVYNPDYLDEHTGDYRKGQTVGVLTRVEGVIGHFVDGMMDTQVVYSNAAVDCVIHRNFSFKPWMNTVTYLKRYYEADNQDTSTVNAEVAGMDVEENTTL